MTFKELILLHDKLISDIKELDSVIREMEMIRISSNTISTLKKFRKELEKTLVDFDEYHFNSNLLMPTRLSNYIYGEKIEPNSESPSQVGYCSK